MENITIVACAGITHREIYKGPVEDNITSRYIYADVIIATYDSRRIVLHVFGRVISRDEKALYIEDDERLPKNIMPKVYFNRDFITLEY